MNRLSILAVAGVVGAIAAPAAAQYYPSAPQAPYPAPGYAPPPPGYAPPAPGYGIGNDPMYSRYAGNDRQAIARCVSAAQLQFGNGYRNNSYATNQYGQRWAYNPSYQANARVTAVTNVDRRQWGVKVNGLMSSGLPYGGGYNQANPVSDLSFRCDVNYNGAVTNLRVNRIQPRRTLGY